MAISQKNLRAREMRPVFDSHFKPAINPLINTFGV
jgi:hypothetical protein